MIAAGTMSPAGSSALSPDVWLYLPWLREWQLREARVWARLSAMTSDWRAGRLEPFIFDRKTLTLVMLIIYDWGGPRWLTQ